MSNIHTGILGTGSGATRSLRIDVLANGMWGVAVTGTEQVFTSTSLDGALRAALRYLGHDEVLGNLGATVTLLNRLLRASE